MYPRQMCLLQICVSNWTRERGRNRILQHFLMALSFND